MDRSKGWVKVIRACLSNWLIPSIAFGPVLLLFVILGLVHSSTAATLGMGFLIVGWAWLLASAVYQFTRRNWLLGFAMIGGGAGTTLIAFVAYSILLTAMTMIDGDHWADDLTIPRDILIHTPLGDGSGTVRPDSVVRIIRYEPALELYRSFQPGMYAYDVWVGRTDKGAVYLKAFEITQEEALSEDRLPETTELKVYNPSDSIVRFASQGSFTIYEGDWGKYYAARFEVWFKPSSGGEESMLLQKNYKIEGWMH